MKTDAPTIVIRLRNYHLGRDLILTVIGGRWHWRIDELNASNSRGYDSHPAAKAAAHAALGLPAIGQAGQHVTS